MQVLTKFKDAVTEDVLEAIKFSCETSDDVACRYLRARQFDIAKAKEMADNCKISALFLTLKNGAFQSASRQIHSESPSVMPLEFYKERDVFRETPVILMRLRFSPADSMLAHADFLRTRVEVGFQHGNN